MGVGRSKQQADADVLQMGDTAVPSGEAIARTQGMDRSNAGAGDAASQQMGNSAALSGEAVSSTQAIEWGKAGAADAAIQQTGRTAAPSGKAVNRTQGIDRHNAGAAEAAIQHTGDTAAQNSETVHRTQGVGWHNTAAPAVRESQQNSQPGMMQRLLGNVPELVISLAISAAMLKLMMGALDPNKDAKRAGKRRANMLSKRLGRRIHLQDLEHVRAAMRRSSLLLCHVPRHHSRGQPCTGCRHCLATPQQAAGICSMSTCEHRPRRWLPRTWSSRRMWTYPCKTSGAWSLSRTSW